MLLLGSLLLAAPLATAAAAPFPSIMLGTGGGGGGFDAPAWLAAGGTAFNTALAYCYAQFTPMCSHVAIATAVAAANASAAAFIATKMEPEDFGPTALISGAFRPFDRSVLQEMNLASIDVVMWHQAGRAAAASNYRPPCFNASAAGPAGPGAYAACRVAGWQAFIDLKARGVAKAIGVSNYEVRDLQQLYDATGVWPEVLEIEVHPYFHPDALIGAFARGSVRARWPPHTPRLDPHPRTPLCSPQIADFALSKGIAIFSYAPLAVGNKFGLLQDPAVLAVAAAHAVEPAQAVLAWGLQRTGGPLLPRSTNPAHMRQNLNLSGIVLSAAEMARLSALPQKKLYNTGCYPWC